MPEKIKVIIEQLQNVELANCTSTDPEIFFPEREDKIAVRTASRVCAVCPIVEDCLEYAIKNENFGIWGGASSLERKRMIRQPYLRKVHLNDMRIVREREEARQEKNNGKK
jgi:WhiB family redox-sensing transcriptional regulator